MRLPPYWEIVVTPLFLWCLGAFLNLLVITANMGAMPVIHPHVYWMLLGANHVVLPPGALTDEVHKVMVHGDHFRFLADWIQIPDVGTASPGDVLIWLGESLKVPAIVAWLTTLTLRTEKIK